MAGRAHRRFRTAAGQPDHRRRRRDAAGGEFRAVGTTGLDARRLRRCVRAHAAGWHRRAISARALPAAKAQALPLSRPNCRPTADDFLWGNSMFNTLGRFRGLERRDGLHRAAFARRISGLAGRGRARRHRAATDRCRDRRRHPRSGYPIPTASSNVICRRSSRRCARRVNSIGTSISRSINRIHVPVALASMLLVVAIVAAAIRRRRLDDLTLLAATVALALLGNAFDLRRDLGAARPLRRANGLDRDIRGADRGLPVFRRHDETGPKLHFRRERNSSTPAL